MEELKQLLLSAYLEIERAKTNAETQRQLQEARLMHLQELLTATRRERDEAREQLAKREAEYSNTEQHVTSRDRSQRPDSMLAGGDLEVNLSTMHYNSSSQSAHPTSLIDPSPDNCPALVDQLRWNSTSDHHFDFPHLDIGADFDLHRPPISSSNVHSSSLIKLQDQTLYDQQEQQLSFGKWQEFKQQQQQQEVEPHLPSLIEDKSPEYDFCQQQKKAEDAAGQLRQSSNTIQGTSEALLGGHMTHHQAPKSVRSPPPSIPGCTSEAIPDHMPQIPGGSLWPERGKLLQAVMQAGPLLKMLFLTGPLPQWRSPPPVLDTVEIPGISMSSPNFLPINPIAHRVPKPHGPADLNSAVYPSHRSLRPRRRTKKPVTAAVTSSLRSSSEAASSSSKLSFFPVLNSMGSSITANPPLDFAQIQ